MRADRLVSLALLLQARGRMSARALAAELEVSVRTVYRDISALSAAGVPVLAEPGPNGGCSLVDGYRFPLRGLSAQEAEALLILGVPAAAAELGLGDAVSSALRKVGATAGLPVGTAIGGRGGQCLVHLDMPRWFHATEEVPHLRSLAAAVRQGRRLLLGYRRDDDDQERTREVGPLGLVNKAGTWYLVAVAGDGQPRVYRAGRITAARVLAAPAARPPGFDLVAFWDSWTDAFLASRPRIEVRARLAPEALAALPYVFGDVGRRTARLAGPAGDDGRREVTLTFEDERAAAQRLAGFGAAAEVLSPQAVRARLLGIARELLTRYADPDVR